MATDPYPFTDEGLTEAVDALGDEADLIADALRALGIRGDRALCDTCPVAAYVQHLYPEATVHVDRSYIRVGLRTTVVEGGQVVQDEAQAEIETPWPVVDFIAAFDAGYYSYLQRGKS
jgi:hypothetical protein